MGANNQPAAGNQPIGHPISQLPPGRQSPPGSQENMDDLTFALECFEQDQKQALDDEITRVQREYEAEKEKLRNMLAEVDRKHHEESRQHLQRAMDKARHEMEEALASVKPEPRYVMPKPIEYNFGPVLKEFSISSTSSGNSSSSSSGNNRSSNNNDDDDNRLPTLEQALTPLQDVVPDLQKAVQLATLKALALKTKGSPLPVDCLTIIALFLTPKMENESIATQVNRALLHDRSRKVWQPFIQLLLHALAFLPPVQGGTTVHWGCSEASSSNELVTSGFQCATNDPQQIGKVPVVFSATVGDGSPIKDVSDFVGKDKSDGGEEKDQEHEYLLVPNMSWVSKEEKPKDRSQLLLVEKPKATPALALTQPYKVDITPGKKAAGIQLSGKFVDDMTAKEVVDLFTELGLSQYVDPVVKAGIDGRDLAYQSREVLVQRLQLPEVPAVVFSTQLGIMLQQDFEVKSRVPREVWARHESEYVQDKMLKFKLAEMDKAGKEKANEEKQAQNALDVYDDLQDDQIALRTGTEKEAYARSVSERRAELERSMGIKQGENLRHILGPAALRELEIKKKWTQLEEEIARRPSLSAKEMMDMYEKMQRNYESNQLQESTDLLLQRVEESRCDMEESFRKVAKESHFAWMNERERVLREQGNATLPLVTVGHIPLQSRPASPPQASSRSQPSSASPVGQSPPEKKEQASPEQKNAPPKKSPSQESKDLSPASPAAPSSNPQENPRAVKMELVMETDIANFKEDEFRIKLANIVGCHPDEIVVEKVVAGSAHAHVLVPATVAQLTHNKARDPETGRRMAEELKMNHVKIGEFGLDVKEAKFNPAWNREYGPGPNMTMWKGAIKDEWDRGIYPYFCPTGWKRYSVDVGNTEEFTKKVSGWAVGYHGTQGINAAKILATGFRKTKYDDLVYFSPSITYCAHPRYARPWCKDKNGKKRYVQMVFQCRVNPKYLTKFYEATVLEPALLTSMRVDPNIPNDRIEWALQPPAGQDFITNDSDFMVCYGIMIRALDQDPQDIPESKWWKHCHGVFGKPPYYPCV